MRKVVTVFIAAIVAIGLAIPSMADDHDRNHQQFINTTCLALGIPSDSLACTRSFPEQFEHVVAVSNPPIATFEFVRTGALATGKRCTRVLVEANRHIEHFSMWYALELDEGVTLIKSNGFSTGTSFDLGCPFVWSIHPKEVLGVRVRHFDYDTRTRTRQYCTKVDDFFKDAFFECNERSVATLPDMTQSSIEDAPVVIFYDEGYVRIKAKVSIKREGLFLVGAVDRDVHGFFDIWPPDNAIPANTIETISLATPRFSNAVSRGWANTEDGGKLVYCGRPTRQGSVDMLVLCGFWSIPWDSVE